MKLYSFVVLLCLSVSFLSAQPAAPQQPPQPPAGLVKPDSNTAPVVRQQEITIGGRKLSYTSTTGMLPLKNSVTGEHEADIFFVAYTLNGTTNPAKRRLTFSFNGGPGSASVWLHMGALGPKRVRMNDDGSLPAAPYHLVPNEGPWLEDTDLVFIDPVGTGYSRAAKPDLGKKFWSVNGDVESVAEFIRLYLARYERWTSPLFLIGESYGTTRAAALSGYLTQQGIALNGVCLVSTILNFQTARFARGNDLPYVLFLPTYTATAWYHKRLPADLQKDLRKTLHEAEAWAIGGYQEALAKGDKLAGAERQSVVDKLARYTGLDKKYLEQADLRVGIQEFIRMLRRDENINVGRLDSRLSGPGVRAVTPTVDFDPSNAAITPPYTATFNQYVRTELGYKTDSRYYILGGGIGRWDWNVEHGYQDVTEGLRSAFAKNPHMKLYIGSGYYDLATPYFAADYTMNHMGLPPAARGNIRAHEYESGHMYYIHLDSLRKMKKDISSFLSWAAPLE
jgi:carboxypeptidase C (cathepsin A)